MALTTRRGGREGEGNGGVESVVSETKQEGYWSGLEGKGYAAVEAEAGAGSETDERTETRAEAGT